jgi:hypothetical protein
MNKRYSSSWHDASPVNDMSPTTSASRVEWNGAKHEEAVDLGGVARATAARGLRYYSVIRLAVIHPIQRRYSWSFDLHINDDAAI